MSASLELAALNRLSVRLARSSCANDFHPGGVRRLPAMLVLTDPARTPDPVSLAEHVPRGVGLVYRTFGEADAEPKAQALSRIARRRGLILLIGADVALALSCGAQGVHLPERDVAKARLLRARWPGVLITAAAHTSAALQRARASGVDAALLSTVFASASLSAGAPIGPIRLALLVRSASVPVYALGGVDGRTAQSLRGGGVAGVALVGAAARALTRG